MSKVWWLLTYSNGKPCEYFDKDGVNSTIKLHDRKKNTGITQQEHFGKEARKFKLVEVK